MALVRLPLTSLVIHLHQANNGCCTSKCIKHNYHRVTTLQEGLGNLQKVAVPHLEFQAGNIHHHHLLRRGTGKNTKANATADPRAYAMLFIPQHFDRYKALIFHKGYFLWLLGIQVGILN